VSGLRGKVAAMPRKPAPKWDDPEESKRFLDEAIAAEASDDPKDLEKALSAITSERNRRHGK
jgi:hypothetical protein